MKELFRDPALFDQAVTHRTWAVEHGGEDNERLEFLGDAVLQICVTRLLYERHPDAREGDLSQTRARVVNTRQLAQVARDLGLAQEIRLGRGEETGVNASSVDVVTGGNIVMTPEDYLALLERERTAAQVERERLGGATEHREGGRGVPAP